MHRDVIYGLALILLAAPAVAVAQTDGTLGAEFNWSTARSGPKPNAPGTPVQVAPTVPSAPAAALTAPSDPGTWTTWVNPRFGARIDYPAARFRADPPPENGDGQAFSALDGRSRFVVWGGFNVLDDTAATRMDSVLTSSGFTAVQEATLDGVGAFRVVASRGAQMVMHAEIVAGDTIFGFQAEIDNPSDTALTAMYARMMASLRGADGAHADDIAPTSALPGAPATADPVVMAPAPGSALYQTLVDTARATLEPELGQSIGIAVDDLRTYGGWAYLDGVPTRPDGSVFDWNASPFARAWQADAMSDEVMVFMALEAGGWRVVDHVIGPTDVYWVSWMQDYGLPDTLFFQP